MTPISRRRFMGSVAAGVGTACSFPLGLPPVSAAEAQPAAADAVLHPELRPLVKWLENTPRERLVEEAAARIRDGLSYRELLGALMLAGVRNIQPRPVGFKFHAVLVVHSAHLASLASPDRDRWLPVLWALDQFKRSQEQDVREGDWSLGPVRRERMPDAGQAAAWFQRAMDDWDPDAADPAAAALARHLGPQEVFEIFCQYGARDFRDIGHKAIYVANAWRTLQTMGWHHAEPVVRSLAYALLDHEGENPARREAEADRPWRLHGTLLGSVREGWVHGRSDPAAGRELLERLRSVPVEEAGRSVIALLNRGVSPESLWPALFLASGEWLMQRPGIVSLHAVTSMNALHFAYRQSAREETRLLMLLQAAAFIVLFRGSGRPEGTRIDTFPPAEPASSGAAALEEVFQQASRDRLAAARLALRYLESGGSAESLAHAGRRWIFQKGTDSHDYKFSSAVMEDYLQLPPEAGRRFLASSLFWLKGSDAPDPPLVGRIRQALRAG